MTKISVSIILVGLAILFCHRNLKGAETVAFAPHTFTIPDGYELKRVAAPPLVQRPMHMYFDDSGVLYVTDSSGDTRKAPVQLKEPKHRVLRLVDRDGDGTFDESAVFADKLPFPGGILVHDGAVYVGAPPYIWKLRDSDGDHVADQRTVWFDGGSIENCGNEGDATTNGNKVGHYTATLYDGPQDNVVFNAATIWWANGLSSPPGHVNPIRHGVAQQGPDERVEQITHNLFERMIG